VPGAGDDAEIIATGTYTVTITTGGVAVDNLTTAAGATLAIGSGDTLNLFGSKIANAGAIQIAAGSGNSELAINQAVSLTGGGTVTMSNSSTNVALIAQAVSGSPLTNVDNTIQGSGQIGGNSGLVLVNQGTIDANVSGQTLALSGGGDTNSNLLEATNGGTLSISTNVTNTSANITANGGTVAISNSATIAGGTLNSSGGGVLEAIGDVALNGVTISSGSTYSIGSGDRTDLIGTIDNAGAIQIAAGSNNAQLDSNGPVSLTGGGTVTMSNSGPFVAFLTQAVSGSPLTNVDNTIQGSGQIGGVAGLTLVNQGTIDANVSGQTLALNGGGITNTGILEATNGGLLVVTPAIAGTGQLEIGAGSEIELGAATSEMATFIGEANAKLRLDVPGSYSGTIASFSPGDILELANTNALTATPTLNGANTTLTVSLNGGGTLTYSLAGNLTNDTFNITHVGSDSDITVAPTAYVVTRSDQFGTIDLSTGAFNLLGNMSQQLSGLGVSGDNLYGGASNTGNLYHVNPTNGDLTLVGSGTINYLDTGSTTGGLYAIGGPNALGAALSLYSINPTTGAATLIGPTGLSLSTTEADTIGLSTGSGTLYFTLGPTSSTATLYSLNTTTGAATAIGGTGVDALGAEVFENGVLYAGSNFNGTTADSLYTLNVTTGAGSFVANEAGGATQFFGLASLGAQLAGQVSLTSATEGVALPAGTTVASFTDTNTSDTAANFTATIAFGDGTTVAGTVAAVAGSAGSFTVATAAAHTYADEGPEVLGVTITPASGNPLVLSETVNVAENDKLTATNGQSFSANAGQLFSGPVATFTDSNTANVAGDLTASINWGDGTTTAGTVMQGSNGTFTVNGMHTYAASGTDTVTVTLADDAPGTATATATNTANVGGALSVQVTLSGTAQEGQKLTANASSNDPQATINYQWQSSIDGVTFTPIANAGDASTYVIQESDEDREIRVIATAIDTQIGAIASATSSPTIAVTDVVPLLSVTIGGTAQQGRTLTAIAVANDSDATITYHWQVLNGATWSNIAGATGSTYTVTERNEGHELRVVATSTDSDGSGTTATSAPTNPVIDVTPMISVTERGVPQEGRTLTATVHVTSDGDQGTTAYQWQELIGGTWTAIADATQRTYTVTEANEGNELRVLATFTDDTGQTVSATSSPTSPVEDRPLVLSIAHHSLSVAAGGTVVLPISVAEFDSDDTVSVKISGLTSFETVTDKFDDSVFSGSSITLSAAEVNSGLTLHSSYTGGGHPVNTLTVTATNTTAGESATTPAQTITVTDPAHVANTKLAGVSSQTSSGFGAGDNFVFNFARSDHIMADFHPHSDVVELGKSAFENAEAILNILHDDHHGNPVVAVDGHETTSFGSPLKAHLHVADFHFVV
jgi:hypothetical protein